jgi:hypothetical protein
MMVRFTALGRNPSTRKVWPIASRKKGRRANEQALAWQAIEEAPDSIAAAFRRTAVLPDREAASGLAG